MSISKIKIAFFREFANFWRKIPATKRPFAWGGGVETLFGRIPFEHASSLCGASLNQQSFVPAVAVGEDHIEEEVKTKSSKEEESGD